MTSANRNYSMSDSELTVTAGNLVAYMTRDATEFAVRGIDAAAITAFEALGDAFELFPPDVYYRAQVTAEVETKNNARTAATNLVKKISGYFEQQWGLKSWQYSQLGIKGYVNLADAKFISIARNVVACATDNLTTLSAIGLTQAMIDDLEDEAETMETGIHDIKIEEGVRDSKSQERITDGNELYSFVKQYSSIGKLIWENVDESKYNDYVLYPTVHSGLSKPQNLAADYDPMTPPNITLTWDAVTDASSYDVYVSIRDIGSPAGEFTFLNNFATSPAAIPSIVGKRNYHKIKAKNDSQISPYSDEVFVDVTVI